MLLELEGYEPAFAREGEPPDAALARVRPLLVVLVDHALDVARSDIFLTRAARRQIGVVLFAAQGATTRPPPWAQSRRVPWFRMPVDGTELRHAIEQSTSSFRLWRTDTDRRRHRVDTEPNGTLVYLDREGRRWQVYDRRSGDRRQADRTGALTPSGSGHRAFVNEAGEEWRVELAAADFLEGSPAALEQQLSRAKKAGEE
jgi:hypothetical protein